MLDHMQNMGQPISPAQKQRLDNMVEKKKERAAYQQIRERTARGDESIHGKEDKEDDIADDDDSCGSDDDIADDDNESDSKWEHRFQLYQEFVQKTG